MNATEANQWGIILNFAGSILIAPDILRQARLDSLAAQLQQAAGSLASKLASWVTVALAHHPGLQTPGYLTEDGYGSKPWRLVMPIGAIAGGIFTLLMVVFGSEMITGAGSPLIVRVVLSIIWSEIFFTGAFVVWNFGAGILIGLFLQVRLGWWSFHLLRAYLYILMLLRSAMLLPFHVVYFIARAAAWCLSGAAMLLARQDVLWRSLLVIGFIVFTGGFVVQLWATTMTPP